MKTTTLNELRNYISLEAPEYSNDGVGGSTVNWVKVADLWAKIEPLSVREVFSKHQAEGRITHRITIRYRKDVLPEMRLKKGSRLYEIIGVMNELERNRWLQLECKELQL